MASVQSGPSVRRNTDSQIVFNRPKAVSVRSGLSRASGSYSIAGAGLAKRLLFPYSAISEPLPPILKTTGAAGIKELNEEIYDFIALAVRGFVLPWWSKISARDKEFPQEICRIIIHLIRALEERLLVADVPELLASSIPTLIRQHYADYRHAVEKQQTSYSTGLQNHAESLPHIFHSLQPHMAVSPEGVVDANYIRQAVEHVMKACLPPEDWQAEAERHIVREIVVKIILENAFPRVSQPWFIHKLLLELLGPPRAPSIASTPRNTSTLHTLLIIILSAVQVISGFALAAMSAVQSGLQIINEVNTSTLKQKNQHRRQDLTRPGLEMIAEILTMRERGATNAILSLFLVFTGLFDVFLDRLVSYLIYGLLRPPLFTNIVIQSKKNIFPNGYPGPPPIVPTLEEQVINREQLEKRLFDLVPPVIAKVLFGPTLAVQRRTVRGLLDPLNSSPCNIHLLMFCLDAILVTVFPELAVGDSVIEYSRVPSPRDDTTPLSASPPVGTPDPGM